MPSYLFSHPKTKKVIEIVMSMTEEHIYIDSHGVKWNREFTVPKASFDSKMDPNSADQFVRKTANMKGTIGDIQDFSGEMSERRGGAKNDPVKKDYYKNWSKKRQGRKHPDQTD